MAERPWAVPALTAALSAVLSSGVTAAIVRSQQPEVLAVRAKPDVAPEQQHLALLLVAPGAPYRPVSTGNPVDVAALGRGSSAQGLTALGFKRGWAQAWTTTKRERVDAFVLEFGDEKGATGYARGIGNAAALLIKPVPFVVPGVPDGDGLADTVRDRNGMYAQVVVMHKGPRAVLLVFSDTTKTPGPGVVDLARRQYAALPAAP